MQPHQSASHCAQAVGIVPWQNIWRDWNQLTDFDAEAIRRAYTILRFFGARGFTTSEGWEPHTADVIQPTVFGSAWPRGAETLWTLVQRNSSAGASGPQLAVARNDTRSYFDCYHGGHLSVDRAAGSVSFAMEADGYGCVFATPNATVSRGFTAFLAEMGEMTRRGLSTFSKAQAPLLQTMVTPAATAKKHAATPAGMAKIPAVDSFRFVSQGLECETGDAGSNPNGMDAMSAGHDPVFGLDLQFPWEARPQLNHSHSLSLPSFFMDVFPVSCAAFQAFVASSSYKPRDETNFLEGCRGARNPGKRPVTHVSYAEAAAFCEHHGKRLPTPMEWQFAAQGNDTTRVYPWGERLDHSRFARAYCANTSLGWPGPEDSDAHPSGASPFGVQSLVGNVWQ